MTPSTKAQEMAMNLCEEELFEIDDYSLVENSREGNFSVTAARIWVKNNQLRKGDDVTAYLHLPTGALVLFPAGRGLPTSCELMVAKE